MTNETQKAGAVADKLLGVLHCPNCSSPIKGHPDNMCVLNVFIDTLRDRGSKSSEELDQLHANCDADALWNALAKVVDALEDGEYSIGE